MVDIKKDNKRIIAEGKFEYLDKNIILFSFKGIDKDNKFNIQDAKNTIENILGDKNNKNDMNSNIRIIRTIFRRLKEEQLEIKLIANYKSNFPVIDSYIMFIDGKLDKYIPNNKLQKLENTQPIKISEDVKFLCETYREFYHKDIDFRSIVMVEEAKIMLRILDRYNILQNQTSLNDWLENDKFSYYKALGTLKKDETSIKLDEKYRKLVGNIGEIVRQYLVVYNNSLEDLKIVAKMKEDRDETWIYSKEKMESIYTLSRKINNRIGKM